MNKKMIVIVAVTTLVVVAVGIWYFTTAREAGEEMATPESVRESAQTITESATQGALPSLNVETNPLGGATDVNPVSKTNPFAEMKTNPFR